MANNLKLPNIGLIQSGLPKIDPSNFNKFTEVNRLIILGNGFDLAHGLKTSFKDFIEDYTLKVLTVLKQKFKYEDFLISVSFEGVFEDLKLDLSQLEKSEVYKKFMNVLKRDRVIVHKQSDFLKRIFNSIEEKSWVDIELIFFEFLKIASKTRNPDKVSKINSELEELKNHLGRYLKEEVEKKTIVPSEGLLGQFLQFIRKHETIQDTIESDMLPSSICVLNFNYTSLPEEYLNKITTIPTRYIPIHGELNGDDVTRQALVFGYGDELDKDYLEFENMNNDALFAHIKSFKYLHFDHYRSMLEFINRAPFQVHIYGHSCGLSDRTLLNTIFENENCISIKNFYYSNNGKDDYEQKSYAIARHFNKKADLRAKVVNKTKCEPMVQPKDEK